MDVLVADRTQRNAILVNVVKSVTQVAESQIRFEKTVNQFLDQANGVKQHLESVASNSAILLQGLRTLFWLSEVPDDELEIIIALVKEVEKLADTIIRSYAKANKALRPYGLAQNELSAYREGAVALKEATTDLLARFVSLPQDEEFQRLMKELSTL